MTTSPMPIRVEHMADFFTKYHLNPDGEAPWPFYPVLHRFTQPDSGDEYHDHPFAFRSVVLQGGYLEEVVTFENSKVFHPDGRVDLVSKAQVTTISRLVGDSFIVPANHIHRIIELPQGECWTMIIAEPKVQEPAFYRIREGMLERRQWNEEQWKPYTP